MHLDIWYLICWAVRVTQAADASVCSPELTCASRSSSCTHAMCTKKHPLDGNKANKSHLSTALCCPCIYSPLLLLSTVIWWNQLKCNRMSFSLMLDFPILMFIGHLLCRLQPWVKQSLSPCSNKQPQRERERERKSMTHGSACSHMCLHVWEQEKSDHQCKSSINKLCNFLTIKTSFFIEVLHVCWMPINDILEKECVSVNCSCHWRATYWCVADRWRHRGLLLWVITPFCQRNLTEDMHHSFSDQKKKNLIGSQWHPGAVCN